MAANRTSFRPGQSGNRGGRPKAAESLAKQIREATAVDGIEGKELVDFVVSVKRGEGPDDMKDAASRRWATTTLLERGWGKPQEHIELTTGESAPKVDYSVLTDEELEVLERITAKLEHAAAPLEGAGDGSRAVH